MFTLTKNGGCQMNGGLAEAVETGDVGKVRTCLMMQQMNSHKAKWTMETERAALFANPDSEEVHTCRVLSWWCSCLQSKGVCCCCGSVLSVVTTAVGAARRGAAQTLTAEGVYGALTLVGHCGWGLHVRDRYDTC